MVATIPFNPYVTVNAAGSFNIQSDGYIQGTAMPDPSARYRLASGVLATTETLPMWGGVGISETTSPYATGQSQGVAGGLITRATNISSTGAASSLTGFSVFDQNYAMVNTPQSPVPMIGSYGAVNFYRFGSQARVALAIDPVLVDLEGNVITQQVSWDFVNQRLVPYAPAYGPYTITGATWSSTSGGRATFTISGTTDPSTLLAAGDDINVTGVVSTGGTGLGYNGAFTVVSFGGTSGSYTITVTLAAASSPGTYSSGGTVTAGGGAVPCKILNVNVGNSMTVVYSSTTGFASWNRAGSCALVQI